MSKLTKIILLVLQCCLLLLFSGCWGSRETDELGLVLVLGIDKGKENVIEVTLSVAVPKPLGSEGNLEEADTEKVYVEASSIYGALQLGNAFISRDLTLIHNRVVIVSEEIAREGLSKYINPLIRSRDIRRSNFLFITRGTAKEFIEKNRSFLEMNPSRQFELLINAQKNTGLMPISTIDDFYKASKSLGKEAVTALVGVNEKPIKNEEAKSLPEAIKKEMDYLAGDIPREDGNKIDLMGSTVFKGDSLIGFLTGAQTRYYQMVTGSFQSGIFSFPDPQKSEEFLTVVKLKRGRQPIIRVTLLGDTPKIDINLILEGEILSIQSGLGYETGEQYLEFEQFLEEYISREVQALITKTQEEYESDIFGFGDYARKYFWTWPAWEEYQWLKKYPQAEVNVETTLSIRRAGLLTKTVIVK